MAQFRHHPLLDASCLLDDRTFICAAQFRSKLSITPKIYIFFFSREACYFISGNIQNQLIRTCKLLQSGHDNPMPGVFIFIVVVHSVSNLSNFLLRANLAGQAESWSAIRDVALPEICLTRVPSSGSSAPSNVGAKPPASHRCYC